jgi:DNA-binding transcriptional ArsR family regulator
LCGQRQRIFVEEPKHNDREAKMKTNEMSLHEIKVYLALKNAAGRWITTSDLTDSITGVAWRTVRLHTRKLVRLGILEQAELSPAYRYKLSEKASQRNAAYVIRLERAAEMFGL